MAVKAVEAAKAEATGTEELRDVRFEYDGVKYFVPGSSFDDVDFIEAMEDEKVVKMIRTALGEDQWRQFKVKKRTSKDLSDITEALFRAYDASEPGNSKG